MTEKLTDPSSTSGLDQAGSEAPLKSGLVMTAGSDAGFVRGGSMSTSCGTVSSCSAFVLTVPVVPAGECCVWTNVCSGTRYE